MHVLLWPQQGYAHPVLSEVHWAGSDVSTADEWVEMTCARDCPVNLSGMTLLTRSSNGDDVSVVEFDETIVLHEGEFFLIANFDQKHSALSVDPDMVTTRVRLPNTKLFLQLIDDQGQVVDSVDDGSGAPFAGRNSAPKASMERVDLLRPGSDKGNWVTAQFGSGFDEGLDMYGTPGEGRQDRSSSVSSCMTFSIQDEYGETICHTLSYSSLSRLSGSSLGGDALSSHSSVSVSAALNPEVYITEILANPRGKDDDEWIEIANKGQDVVDITGWELSNGSVSYRIPPRTGSGFFLYPGQHVALGKRTTGINLHNSGDTIVLLRNGTELHHMTYTRTGEDVSYGWVQEADALKPLCVPTKNRENTDEAPDVFIEIQSPKMTDPQLFMTVYDRIALNVKAAATNGSLRDATCSFDFRDGYSVDRCNPPSHTIDRLGVYPVTLTVKTVCGEEVRDTLEVSILPSKRFFSSQSSASVDESSSFSRVKKASSSFRQSSSVRQRSSVSIEQKMYTKNVSYARKKYVNVPADHRGSFTDVPFDTRLREQEITHIRENTDISGARTLPWWILGIQSSYIIAIFLRKLL